MPADFFHRLQHQSLGGISLSWLLHRLSHVRDLQRNRSLRHGSAGYGDSLLCASADGCDASCYSLAANQIRSRAASVHASGAVTDNTAMAKPIANLRLFVAAYPPRETAEAMLEALRTLTLPDYRITPIEQVHLTLQFIGDTPARDLDETIESVRRA